MSVRDARIPQAYTLLIAVIQTLNVLGGLSLALSTCLVVNTTSAMLARHVPQIGIMKAIGARSRIILAIYLSMVLRRSEFCARLVHRTGTLQAWS